MLKLYERRKNAGIQDFCARQLSQIIKPKERPWIQPENASKEEIIEKINICPLHYAQDE